MIYHSLPSKKCELKKQYWLKHSTCGLNSQEQSFKSTTGLIKTPKTIGVGLTNPREKNIKKQ